MNVMVNNGNLRGTDAETLFSGESFWVVDDCLNLPQLLKYLGIYKSTSEAIRCGRKGNIPEGYTQMKASKKVELFIWNPTEE